MHIHSWKTIRSERPFKYLRVDQCILPNGQEIEKLILEYDPWAAIVAVTNLGELIMIKQYRHAAGKVIWEIPAGVIENGEDSLAGAKRELLEETGYGGGNWFKIGEVSPNPDNHTNHLHIFLAIDVQFSGGGELDPEEEIEVHLIPIEQAYKMARKGELSQAMQVSALFFAQPYLTEKGFRL